ncbi:MAG: hypothetical protein E6L07_15035 [Verrucomicrobia bacterium]|nr:MAG: hypothetical protein E6L07_15035 [Verrucomicrobiota bacterium]
MRTITNDYKDAQILNLASQGERGPYLITQTGIAPSDPLLKTRMFVLGYGQLVVLGQLVSSILLLVALFPLLISRISTFKHL